MNDDGRNTELLLITVDDNYEFGFMTLSNTSILRDPNVFIADTGAMSGTTPFLYGLKNVEEASKEDAITDASGTNISASTHGTLKVVMCDKHGKELRGLATGGFVHMPQSELNLFSISIRAEEGWKLGGDKTDILLQNNDQIIKFYIKEKTEKRAVYSAYIKRTTELAATEGNFARKNKHFYCV